MTTKSLTTVSCPCGASMEVNLTQASAETVCPECGQMLEVVVTVDPKTKVRRVGILVKAAAVAPRRAKTKIALSGGKGTATTEEVHTAKCTCGAQLTIVPKSPDDIFTCSACEAEYTASLKQGKGGTAPLLVLRPVVATPLAEKGKKKTTRFEIPTETPKPMKAVAAPKPAAPAKAAKPALAPAPAPAAGGGNPAAKETLLMMTKGDIGAQEIVTGEEGSTILCYCGQAMPLKGDFHQGIHKCRDCGMAFRIFAATHPKKGTAMAVMIPRDAGK